MSLLETLSPFASAVAGVDLAAPDALATLRARSPNTDELMEVLLAAHRRGTLTPRDGGEGIHFGRVAKASEATHGLSIDAVDIVGTGAEHTHPMGEVSFCIPLEGEPRFEGAREGWVVLPPGSHHAPTVEGGRMLIVYFLPDGQVSWGPRS